MATLNKYHNNSVTNMTAALRRRWVALRLSAMRLAGIGKTSQAVHSLLGFLAVLFSAVLTAGKKGYVCKICGWVYEGKDLPEDIICPLCKHGAADFEKI